MTRQINHAISTPQNNFRIFVNGSLAFGGMGGGADNVHPADTQKCIEDLSKVSGLELPDFTEPANLVNLTWRTMKLATL